MRIIAIVPVGPEIWYDAPPKTAMTNPLMIAVIIPLAAVCPELTAKAKASGSATAATVRPAIRSLVNVVLLYPENSRCKSERNEASFGLLPCIPPTSTLPAQRGYMIAIQLR